LSQIIGAAVAVGLTAAVALTPMAALGGVAAKRTNETMQSNLQDLTEGATPGVTTITDKNGTPFAWVFGQRRYEIKSEDIPQAMKDAIVSIEDRRFYEHKGVDIQGNIRAVLTNFVAGGVEQGASTLDQQYVKNYLLLATARTDEERQAATEQSIPRKLREMRMASAIDKMLSKDEVLTRYLNLVPFGNHAYGIEAAARVYFGKHAKELNVPQSAMLAGMVQSSSVLNPYTNEEGVKERRSTVLDEMARLGKISQEDADKYKKEPLGVLDEPQQIDNGCITAGDKGFFCDYVLKYLDSKNMSLDDIKRGSYTIRTSLDPNVQKAAHDAVTRNVDPQTEGVAEIMNVVEPGKETRYIRAMTSSRNYGLDADKYETMLPQTASLVGHGAGSVFKVFTAAAALDQGYGINTPLAVPAQVNVAGMGSGGAAGCPEGLYCVRNAGSYPGTLTLKDALAQSPNTTFVKLIEQVTVPTVMDLAVKLGMRSYAKPGTWDGEKESIADHIKKHNMGSFTLGPTAVNGLELSNVAASIASGGVWCEPSPIEKVTDQKGKEVFIDTPACENALNEDVAYALSAALSGDAVGHGTAAQAARANGWSVPVSAKTGTTEAHESAAFMGFNDKFAAATYIFNDGTSSSPICSSPARQCGWGDIYGGYEPARTWFQAANAVGAQSGSLPSPSSEFSSGRTQAMSQKYQGRNAEEVEVTLRTEGYDVQKQAVPGNGAPKGTVVKVIANPPLRRGSKVTLQVSDGTGGAANQDNQNEEDLNKLQNDINNIAEELKKLFGGG
jgi:hypothetical protein